MKIMVTGAGGQLGQELVKLDPVPGIEVVGVDRKAMDITDAKQCKRVVRLIAPDVIIHTAAYTAVDLAEKEVDLAWRVNAEGTRNVAMAAEAIGAKLCCVSTDYVFNGFGTRPYEVVDPTEPRTVYGRTKLAGERLAATACSQTFIVRTSWVYGLYGENFVNTLLKLAKERREVTVVNDQTGAPTYTLDLAQLLMKMVRTDRYGLYHASNAGSCTWYEMALAIYEEAGLSDVMTVNPCSTQEFPRPAPRPAYSVLGHEALIGAGFKPLRHWREALCEYLHG